MNKTLKEVLNWLTKLEEKYNKTEAKEKRSPNKFRTYKKKGKAVKKIKHEPLRDLDGNIIPEASNTDDTGSIFSTKESESPLTLK